MKEKLRLLSMLFLCMTMVLTPVQTSLAEGDEPEQGDDPAQAAYQLTGTVYQYAYSASESSGTPLDGASVKITTKSGNQTVTTGSGGKFTYTFTSDDERNADGKYSWSIESTDDHYSASGTMQEGTEEEPEDNKLYVRERYIPKASDYSFAESDDVKEIDGETWVKQAGSYSIKGVSGKTLAKILDGTDSETISVNVASNGSLDSFFVFISGLCSKILTGQSVHVDSGAPVINSVSTSAAASGTYVKEHGIYGKSKAELAVNADITEDAGIKEAYVLVYKGEETTRYDAVRVGSDDSRYNVTIGLPDEETIMDARLVKLVVVDVFGSKSNEALLAATEDGSKVTLEQISPTITKSDTGKKSSYGWYSEMPTLTASAEDTISGLASLSISGHGTEVASKTYTDKTKEKQTVSGYAGIDEETDDGAYTYTIEAVDNSGNVGTDAIKVKIDLEKPSVSAEGVKTGEHYNYKPEIVITEDEKYYSAKGNRIFVEVSRDGNGIHKATYEKKNNVTVRPGVFSEDGVYEVKIYAKDAADNESNILKYKFTIDATAPVITLSGVKNGRFYNKRQTVTVTVKEHNYKTDTVKVGVLKKLGKSSKSLSFPWSNKGKTSVCRKTYAETGTYTVAAKATDKAGNNAKPKKVTFTIDTKAPVITITGVKDKGIYLYGQGLAPKVSVTDDYLASKSVTYTKAGRTVTNPSFEQIKENDGLYTMTATAVDKAGNRTTKTITFTVNRFGSHFEYSDAVKDIMGKAVQTVNSDLVITEKNVSKVTSSDARIYRDGKAIDEKGKTTPNEGGAENVYTHTFASSLFDTEGAYEINVASKDEVGNEMESREENGAVKFFVDRTEPTIVASGIDPKGNNAESIDVDLKIDDTLTGVREVDVTIDGEHMNVRHDENTNTYAFTVNEGLRQHVEVTAVDGAGNTARYSETASVSTNAAALFFNRFGRILGAVVAALLAALAFFFIKRRKKDDDEEAGEEE